MPVSGHPLFPAVVASWFAASLGLGSLMIRTSLIESFVVATRFDLLVPAAAPPLGTTARILLALGLAAFGATLGAWIGRKLGQRLPQRHERNRDVLDVEPEAVRVRPRDAHPDAPARRPISAHDEFNLTALGAPTLTGEELLASPAEPAREEPPVHPAVAEPLPTLAPLATEPAESIEIEAVPLPDLARRLTEAMSRRRASATTAPGTTGTTMAQPASPTPAEPSPELSGQPGGVDDRDERWDEDEDECTDEARFGSLLSVNREPMPRSEPATRATPGPLDFAAEPVIIFPDQAARSAASARRPAFGARPGPGAAGPVPNGETGYPAAAHPTSAGRISPVHRDPAETDRALRAALASLQRISGAA